MDRTGEMNEFFNKPLDILDKVIIDADYNFLLKELYIWFGKESNYYEIMGNEQRQ